MAGKQIIWKSLWWPFGRRYRRAREAGGENLRALWGEYTGDPVYGQALRAARRRSVS